VTSDSNASKAVGFEPRRSKPVVSLLINTFEVKVACTFGYFLTNQYLPSRLKRGWVKVRGSQNTGLQSSSQVRFYTNSVE